MPDPEIRTFMIADVRGYTSFTQSHGDEAAARLAATFAEIAREGVEARGGEVIELRGDEALAVFTSARQALRAAIDLQLVFAEEYGRHPSMPLRVGIGVDAGEAVPVEQGYRGGALNLAARLCSKAGPGEVLASQGVAHLARATDGLRFHEHGTFEMKGLPEPVAVVRVAPEGLDPETLAARFVLDGERVSTLTRRTEIPAVLDPVVPIVGREKEVRSLRWAWRQVRGGTGRVVVVVGPAGIGKTRLAAAAAELPADEGAEVAYVGCADLDDATAAATIDASLSADLPGLLVVDDADAAGSATLTALAAAGRSVRERRILLLITYQEENASPELLSLTGRLAGGEAMFRPAPLGLEEVREIAALYLGAAAAALPASTLESTRGVPRKVHEFVSEWARSEASRRLGEAASKAALGRSGLREVEADLAGSVVDLQLVEERSRLFGAGARGRHEIAADDVPFKGLATFEVQDAKWFFGRERLVADVIARLAGSSFLGVVGPSGSGKSSAVRAGLVPALRAGALPASEGWIVVVMRPGKHPLRELDRSVWAALPEDLRRRLADADQPLRAARDALAPGDRIVVVVDQFEELFTAGADEAEQTAFVAALTEAALDPRANEAVVLAIRADFYGRCAVHPELAALLGSNHVLVGPMTPEEYRRAIEQPAIRAGLRVEPALADALVAEVVEEPGGLPLLSTALLELWERRDGRTLRTRDLVETGGVRGAVARLAEDVYGSLTEAQRGVTRSVMLRLAGPGDGDAVVRRRVTLAEFDTSENPDVSSVLHVFTQRRLLTVSEGSVEVAHEALLREWPRLQEWLDDDRASRRLRAHLIDSAKEWDVAGRDASELYRGTRLDSTIDWTTEHTLELNELERDFLNASRAAADAESQRQRRTNRRLRGLLVGTGVFLAFALIAGSFAFVQRDNAQRAATEALARSLGAQGVTQPQLSRALLLADEGVNLAPSNQTEGSLLSTLLRAPGVTKTYTVPESERPLAAGLVSSDRTLALATNANAIHFYDVASASPLGSYPGSDSVGVTCCAATPGGLAAAVLQPYSGGPTKVVTIDPATGQITRTFAPDPRLAGFVLAVLNGQPPDATVFVPYFPTDTSPLWIDRWDAANGRLIGRTKLPGVTTVSGMNVTNGGARLCLVTNLGEVELDASSMRVVHLVRFNGAGPFGATNANATRAVFSTASPGGVDFVDLGTGKITEGVGNPITQINALQFSPTDPALAASTGDDGKTVIWDAATARADQVLPLQASRVTAVIFSADGSRFFSVSLDGTAVQWALTPGQGFGSEVNVAAPGVDLSTQPLGSGSAPFVAAGSDHSYFQSGDRIVTSVDDATGERISFAASPPGFALASIALSPDGRTLAVGSEGGKNFEKGSVRLWDVSGIPRLARTLPVNVPYPSVNTVGFSDDGQEILATTGNRDPNTGAVYGGYLMGWRSTDGSSAFPPILFKKDSVHQVVLDPSGGLAAVGLGDTQGNERIRLVSFPGGQQVGSDVPIPISLDALAFASDGSLLSGGWTGLVQRWSIPSLQPIGQPVLTGGGPIGSVVAVPNSSLFATTNFDGSTKLWDLNSGQEIGSSFTPLVARWLGAAISPDGRTLAILAMDGNAWLFPLSEQGWAQHACDVAGRNLTPTEWSQFVGDRPYAKVCPQYSLP